ncbi:DUF4199 domain-containing protein [Ulvibacterium marinum]|uniref:DUF4199 domain-containing protein n=1 Tax=Ulvibacterium marinum TaxID=2419782 RepID=A0A3B0C673_9FLAO|nr:DUF4199 domain-containing protein [Ulvibacterium marinum]RKN81623.1 DUF4199 domain-containing protein [Ulvibacterium marinum]
MEENQPKTGKFSLNYGLITGAVGILFALILFSMDMHYERGFSVQGVQIAILAAGILLAISQFKKASAGYLSLSEALKLGAGVALIAGLLGLLYFFLFSNFIEPDFMDNTYELGKQKALQDNPELTEEQIDQGIEFQKSLAWITYPIILVMNIVIGLIVGLIGGLIMKKQKPAY